MPTRLEVEQPINNSNSNSNNNSRNNDRMITTTAATAATRAATAAITIFTHPEQCIRGRTVVTWGQQLQLHAIYRDVPP
eukprot:353886-Chlamydomonas_euryale.AAC.3